MILTPKHMTIFRAIKVIRTAIWRLSQIAIVIPASIVGSVVMSAWLAGHSPVSGAVRTIHYWAEADVRPAPAGMVFIAKCPGPASQISGEAPGKILPPIDELESVCNWAPISINEFSQSVSRQASGIYAILVVWAVFWTLLLYPGKRYFGLADEPFDAARRQVPEPTERKGGVA